MTAEILPFERRTDAALLSNGTSPRRRRVAEPRSREYLTPSEVERLITAARGVGRHGHRDATLILIAYRHGLRVSELIALRRDQLDLKAGTLHVARLKNGRPSVHPVRGPELRALRRLQREYPPSPYVFVTERGGPMTDRNVHYMVARAAGSPSCRSLHTRTCFGTLAATSSQNDGHDTRSVQAYLGHSSIQSTVRYTELAPQRFNGFWKD